MNASAPLNGERMRAKLQVLEQKFATTIKYSIEHINFIDIAFEFASWISVEFKLNLIKGARRRKEVEFQQLVWDTHRNLAKVNYLIHIDAIKENLIPDTLTPQQVDFICVSEAHSLNVAMYGISAGGNFAEQSNRTDFTGGR